MRHTDSWLNSGQLKFPNGSIADGLLNEQSFQMEMLENSNKIIIA
jgi:hypothetical protein